MRWTQKNFLLGCVFLAVSLIFIFILIPAQVSTTANVIDFQPTFFPYFSCIVMAFLAVIMMVANLFKDRMLFKDLLENIKNGLTKENQKIAFNVMLIFVLFCLYLLLFNWLGFVISTAVVLPVMMHVMGWRKPIVTGIITILVIVGLYVFFAQVMMVRLP